MVEAHFLFRDLVIQNWPLRSEIFVQNPFQLKKKKKKSVLTRIAAFLFLGFRQCNEFGGGRNQKRGRAFPVRQPRRHFHRSNLVQISG